MALSSSLLPLPSPRLGRGEGIGVGRGQEKNAVNKPRGIILDLDGTVYRGEQLIPGARETIEWLRGRGHPIVFVTNAIETLAEHVDKLAGLGVPARPGEII